MMSKPAAKKPALPNRRPLSAIEADIIATQTDDTANLIKRGEYLIEAKEGRSSTATGRAGSATISTSASAPHNLRCRSPATWPGSPKTKLLRF